MYNKKKVLEELYEIKVSQTISLKTIYHFKHLLNHDNFLLRQKIKEQIERFVEHENINSLYLEESHIQKGKEYLIKKLLTKDLNNFRRNENIVFSDLSLATILKYKDNLRFLFLGFASISNGIYYCYEPIYEIIIYNREYDFYYEIDYIHHNNKDYEIDFENCELRRNEKYSNRDNELYLWEIIKL